MAINWLPGHMKRTKEQFQKNLKATNIVFELLDARAPISTKNNELDKIIGNKARIIILNKSDLGDKTGNTLWLNYFNKNYEKAIAISAVERFNKKILFKATYQILQNDRKPVRAIVVGVPNVGKSTFINTLSGKKGTKTGNEPGITKNIQWIKVSNKLDLLDTPGLLDPTMDRLVNILNLSIIGVIKNEEFDVVDSTLILLEILIDKCPRCIEERYKININGKSPQIILNEIAQKRGCIQKNSSLDQLRASLIILKEYRQGMIGKVTLEYPND